MRATVEGEILPVSNLLWPVPEWWVVVVSFSLMAIQAPGSTATKTASPAARSSQGSMRGELGAVKHLAQASVTQDANRFLPPLIPKAADAATTDGTTGDKVPDVSTSSTLETTT